MAEKKKTISLGGESKALLEVLRHRESRHARLRLDIDSDVVDAVAALDDDLVFWEDSGDFQQRLFDLLREEVDSLDDEHVVQPSVDSVDAEACSSAGALFPGEDSGDVPGAEPEDGQRLACEGCDDDVSVLSVREDLSRLRVDHFRNVLVFPDMDAAVCLAVHSRGSHAAGFRHSVDVEGLDSGACLDFPAHFIGECLRTEDSDLEVREVHLQFVGHLHDSGHV